MRAEHFKALLQDQRRVSNCWRTQRHPSPELSCPKRCRRLTALQKPAGGVRGIATGDCFRRLVARAVAKQWSPTFDAAARPVQYALQARAGTDALASQFRVALERSPDAVVVSLDGRATYDTISRESFLTALQEVAPRAASKAIPSPRRCTPWANTRRYAQLRLACARRTKKCLHFWTTFTSLPRCAAAMPVRELL